MFSHVNAWPIVPRANLEAPAMPSDAEWTRALFLEAVLNVFGALDDFTFDPCTGPLADGPAVSAIMATHATWVGEHWPIA
jgi:hypothetical protein